MDKEEDGIILPTIISFIVFFAQYKNEISFLKFKEDIIYKNRFNSNHKVLQLLKKYAKKESKNSPTKTINKGEVFYRARVYEKDAFYETLLGVLQSNDVRQELEMDNKIYEESIESINNLSESERFMLYLAFLSWALVMDELQKTRPDLLENKVIQALDKTFNDMQTNEFKGHDKKGSTAPPASFINAGRANPNFIRYLYMAEDMATAIYEVRPIIGQSVSVAKLIAKEELKIYDLTINIEESKTTEESIDCESLFNVLSNEFSTPNYNDPKNYIPTQYIAEYIKNLGYDGIRFNSSLCKGGKNITLFYPDKCEPISSDTTTITDVKVSFTDIAFKEQSEDPPLT